MESAPTPIALDSLLTKIKGKGIAVSSFRFCDSSHATSIVRRMKVSAPMTLLQAKKRKFLLSNAAKMLFVNVKEKQKDVSAVTHQSAATNPLEEAR